MKEFGRMSLTAAADVGDFESSDAKLQRRITLIGLIGLAVSIQVGSGWLLATLAAVSRSGPAAIIAWIIGAVFFAVIGVAWMELGTMLPRSGGGVRYPRLSHGAFLSWLNGWGYLISIIALPVVEAQAVLTYVGGHWPSLGLVKHQEGTTLVAWPNGILAGWGLLVVFFLLNVFGVLLLSESNKWVTVWKLVVPTITAILMFTAFKAENFRELGGFAPMGYGAVFGAVSGGGIVFAYNGLRQIVDFGGEVINPRRNIPIAMIVGGVIIPLVLYLALQIGFIGALDWHSAGVSPGDWKGLMESPWAAAPLLQAVTVAGFAWFAVVLLSDAVLSPSATGWVFVGLAGRTAYSLSVNGELPRGLQRINRFGVPWIALMICTGLGFFMFLPVPSWYQFVGMVATAMVLNYLMAGPTMAVFRRVAPQLPRPVRIPFGGFWGVAGYLCSLLLIYFAGWSTMINVITVTLLGLPIYSGYASVRHGWSPRVPSIVLSVVFTLAWMYIGIQGGWLFAGGKQITGHWPIGLYFAACVVAVVVFVATLWAVSNAEGRMHIRAGLWILPTLVVTTFLAYFGDAGPQPVLRSGLDVLLVIIVGIASYLWAVRSGYRTDELNDILRHHDDQQEKATAGAT
jgi:amino acid transporter